MIQPTAHLTEPILAADSSVWFSAYRFGWGYCAYSLPREVLCEKLGATDGSPKQLMLAFALNKSRLVRVIEHRYPLLVNERITLAATDL
ncbi:hypothetical protein AB4Y45_14110 [Paraburkholderia sp. EG287A]|uniref:hypothetical protein n=1 Tax=unclassified Paraburkholderia TaxID=2615204 RepID=UPI0034D160A7